VLELALGLYFASAQRWRDRENQDGQANNRREWGKPVMDGPANGDWHKAAGDEGEGVGAATFRKAPRPSSLTRHRSTNPHGLHGQASGADADRRL